MAKKTEQKKETAKPKTVTNKEDKWMEAGNILKQKQKAYDKGELDGHAYNTLVKPCIEKYEAGNRSEHLYIDITNL